MLTRRSFVLASAAATASKLYGRTAPGLRLGVMDGVVGLALKPQAVAKAKELGLAGVQVTLGRADGSGRMPLEDASAQRSWVEASKKHGIPLVSTYIDQLHADCLKKDPAARERVVRGIDATRRLNAPILMTVFFGKCSIENRQELDYTADVFKELAREAEKGRVVLGFENLLNAEDNARAMDRVASEAFKIYYDVANTTNMVGVDAPKEIRFLGRDRICQFHLKDKGYLGEGKVNYSEILAAIDAIGFQGYGVFETSAPSKDIDADLTRNLKFVQKLMS